MNNEPINKRAFGKTIKEARKKIGYTQAMLAEEIGISSNFIGDIERGLKLPSLNNLILLSNTLKLSLDTMFADSLDNMLYEPGEIYYTDKQFAVIQNVIKSINDNF